MEYPLLLASTLTANGDSTFVCSLKQVAYSKNAAAYQRSDACAVKATTDVSKCIDSVTVSTCK